MPTRPFPPATTAAAMFLALTTGLAAPARADAPAPLTLTLRDHRFTPETLTVAAGERFRLRIVNEDGATEEFDSEDLGVERFITPHSEAVIELGPLQPGTYSFMGEFHPLTAGGRLLVEARP